MNSTSFKLKQTKKVEMSDSFSTPNSFNFQNTPIPNLTTQMKTEDHPTGSIPHFSMTGHIAAPHNSGFVNSILHPTALSSPLLSNSKTTHAVPLFRSNSIDSDKFLPASCLNQLVKDFYKSSSGQNKVFFKGFVVKNVYEYVAFFHPGSILY